MLRCPEHAWLLDGVAVERDRVLQVSSADPAFTLEPTVRALQTPGRVCLRVTRLRGLSCRSFPHALRCLTAACRMPHHLLILPSVTAVNGVRL